MPHHYIRKKQSQKEILKNKKVKILYVSNTFTHLPHLLHQSSIMSFIIKPMIIVAAIIRQYSHIPLKVFQNVFQYINSTPTSPYYYII